MKSFEIRQIVSLEDTNAVGNAYYTTHLSWQGRCREMFLRQHAPDILPRLGKDLCLVTSRCSCEYFAELSPYDEVIVRLRLGDVVQNRMNLHFEYYRVNSGDEELVARGEQQIAAMTRDGDRMIPIPIPDSLREALRPFKNS